MSVFGRATIQKSTGKLIEFQSGDAPLGTLKQNAINSGISESDIEEKYITQAELDSLLPKPPAPKNYKALYAAATTPDQKDTIFAEMLGLV